MKVFLKIFINNQLGLHLSLDAFESRVQLK